MRRPMGYRLLALVIIAASFVMLDGQAAPASTIRPYFRWHFWWATTTTAVTPPTTAIPVTTIPATTVAPPPPVTTVPPPPPTTVAPPPPPTTVPPVTTTTVVNVINSNLLLGDNFSTYPLGLNWADGSSHGNWTSVFNGYGQTGIATATSSTGTGINVLSETPEASTSPSETHSALVTSNSSFGNMNATVDLRTTNQLRTPTPNGWEAGWVLWDYSSTSQFYYFIPKPNGWELGKEDPAYPGSQRFLATGSQAFPIGSWYTVRVQQAANTMSVWVNGSLITTFTDTERPYQAGKLGLYTEDAAAQFANVRVSAS